MQSSHLQSLTPAYDQKQRRQLIEAIEKCGKNMGPHDYVPIEWQKVKDVEIVTKMLCRVCFYHVEVETLLRMYGELKL